MTTDTSFSRSAAPAAVERDLAGLLVEALRLLGAQGSAHEANQIAARAWWALEHGDERARHRINGVMHHLARLPTAPPVATDPAETGPAETGPAETGPSDAHPTDPRGADADPTDPGQPTTSEEPT